jgi:hypothetical protein
MNKRNKKAGNEKRTPKRSHEVLRVLDIRQNPGIQRGSTDWKAVYNKRTSVERLFSRMKALRRLDNVRHRGIAKVTLHVYLSTQGNRVLNRDDL